MYHLFVTYLNVSPVRVAALKLLILLCFTVLCWFHHIVLFLMPVMWHWPKCALQFSFWISSIVKSKIVLLIFCSVSQQMFYVCCKTLMSCFQIITHWLHGQQKNLNSSKYNCMYLSVSKSPLSFPTQLLRLFLDVTQCLFWNPAPFHFCGFWFSFLFFFV